MYPHPKDFKTFDEFEEAWHAAFKEKNPDWSNMPLYTNAQFDELPYIYWDEYYKIKSE